MDDLQYSKLYSWGTPWLPVLNLVINGWPSILNNNGNKLEVVKVLNLVINGWPSIHGTEETEIIERQWF